MKFINKLNGFSLIEVVIYIAIISAILTVAIFFTWDVISNQTKSIVIVEVNQNSRYILEKVARDIRQANRLNSVSSNTLSIDLIGGDTIIYVFDDLNQTIGRQLNVGSQVVLNSSVVNATGSWENLSTPQSTTIGLNLTVEYGAGVDYSDWQSSLTTNTSYELTLDQ